MIIHYSCSHAVHGPPSNRDEEGEHHQVEVGLLEEDRQDEEEELRGLYFEDEEEAHRPLVNQGEEEVHRQDEEAGRHHQGEEEPPQEGHHLGEEGELRV